MRLPRLSSLILATVLLAAVAAAQANPQVQTIWRLLDYVAVDYPEAVQGGAVVNQLEYDEMLEFSATVRERLYPGRFPLACFDTLKTLPPGKVLGIVGPSGAGKSSLAHWFQGHGYKVLTANNGEDALEILNAGEEVNLLISDVVMPLMDGPTMVREARKDRPELPILFMSGYAEEQLRREIDIEGMHFIPKPFSVQQIAAKVGEVLRAGRR